MSARESLFSTREEFAKTVLRMWNLIEEAWMSDNEDSVDRHDVAITACMDFIHDVPSHEVYEAALGLAPPPKVGDTIPFFCSACGKEKPNDTAWARPAMGCECGNTVWTATVTFRG